MYRRDEIASTSSSGKKIIQLHYQWNPVIEKALGENEGPGRATKHMIEWDGEVLERKRIVLYTENQKNSLIEQ